jgi:hypothetical protein
LAPHIHFLKSSPLYQAFLLGICLWLLKSDALLLSS